MRALLLLAALSSLAACRARTGAQDLSDDAFNETTAADFVPLPAPLDSLGYIQQHPTGLTVGLRRIEFQPDHVRVNLRIVNPSQKRLILNKYRKMRLRDSGGQAYDLVAPEHNKELVMHAGTTLDTTLAFKGGFAETATSVTLVTNDGPGGESNLTTQPKMFLGPIAVHRTPR